MIEQSLENDRTAEALLAAAQAVRSLREALSAGMPEIDVQPLIDEATRLGSVAIEAVVVDEDWGAPLDDPTTRRSRFAYAGWLMFLEGAAFSPLSQRRMEDLHLAIRLLEQAAAARIP